MNSGLKTCALFPASRSTRIQKKKSSRLKNVRLWKTFVSGSPGLCLFPPQWSPAHFPPSVSLTNWALPTNFTERCAHRSHMALISHVSPPSVHYRNCQRADRLKSRNCFYNGLKVWLLRTEKTWQYCSSRANCNCWGRSWEGRQLKATEQEINLHYGEIVLSSTVFKANFSLFLY